MVVLFDKNFDDGTKQGFTGGCVVTFGIVHSPPCALALGFHASDANYNISYPTEYPYGSYVLDFYFYPILPIAATNELMELQDGTSNHMLVLQLAFHDGAIWVQRGDEGSPSHYVDVGTVTASAWNHLQIQVGNGPPYSSYQLNINDAGYTGPYGFRSGYVSNGLLQKINFLTPFASTMQVNYDDIQLLGDNPPAPVASFTFAPASGFAGVTSFAFTDTSTGPFLSYHWDFGDGNTSTLQNPTHTYAAAGTYTVVLTVTNGWGSSSTVPGSTIIVSNPLPPVASFTFIPALGVAGVTSFAFTDTSTNAPTSWLWNFGDGHTSTAQNPSHVYTNPGTYFVTLQATNAYGTGTSPASGIDVGLPPVASFTFTPPSPGTSGITVFSFVDTSTNSPTGWLWDFGDGHTSLAQAPLHIYANPGTYTVTLQVTNPYGTDTTVPGSNITIVYPYIAPLVFQTTVACPITKNFECIQTDCNFWDASKGECIFWDGLAGQNGYNEVIMTLSAGDDQIIDLGAVYKDVMIFCTADCLVRFNIVSNVQIALTAVLGRTLTPVYFRGINARYLFVSTSVSNTLTVDGNG